MGRVSYVCVSSKYTYPKGVVTSLGCRRTHERSGAPSAKVHLPARKTGIPTTQYLSCFSDACGCW
jgi:hypothetical protein